MELLTTFPIIVLCGLLVVSPTTAATGPREVGRCNALVEACYSDGETGDPTCPENPRPSQSRTATIFSVGIGNTSAIGGAGSGTSIQYQDVQTCTSDPGGGFAFNHTGRRVTVIGGPVPGVLDEGQLAYVSWQTVNGTGGPPSEPTSYENGTYVEVGVGTIAVHDEGYQTGPAPFVHKECGLLPCPFSPPPPPPGQAGDTLACWDGTSGFDNTSADLCYANQEARFYSATLPGWASNDVLGPYLTQPIVPCVPTQHICERLPPASSLIPVP